LKKRSKKLLLPRSGRRRAPNNQKFFGSFFQKRTAFFLHPIALGAMRLGIAPSSRPGPHLASDVAGVRPTALPTPPLSLAYFDPRKTISLLYQQKPISPVLPGKIAP
jgi:hypothetical protein